VPRPLIFPFVLSLLLTACAAPGTANPRAEIEAAAAHEVAAHPTRYEFGASRSVLISQGGVPRALIWGTVHDSADVDGLPRPALQALAHAASLWVELDLASLPATELDALTAQRAASLADASPAALDARGPDTRHALAAAGLGPGAQSRHSLEGLADLLREDAETGTADTLPAAASVDQEIIGFAHSLHIPVHPLERLADQATLLYSDPNGEAAAAELRVLLRRRPDLQAFTNWVHAAYAHGQIGAIAAAFQAWRVTPAEAPVLARRRLRLSDSRNAAMADTLAAALRQPGFLFVAIGIDHLLGDTGVPALLEQAGYQATPCPEAACLALQ